jgi:hypothetical protein
MVINEITLTQIKQNNTTGFPGTRKRQFVVNLTDAKNIKFTPYIPSGTLIISADTTSNGNSYKTSIEFKNVEFDESLPVAIKCADNQVHNIRTLDENRTEVSVNCDCMDFRFRFADFHYQNKSLVGDPPPAYIKKTNRPPVNPKKSLGGCKHVLSLVSKLRQIKVIR